MEKDIYDTKLRGGGGIDSSDLLRLNSFKFELLIQTNSKSCVSRFNIRWAPFISNHLAKVQPIFLNNRGQIPSPLKSVKNSKSDLQESPPLLLAAKFCSEWACSPCLVEAGSKVEV